jgi:antitoxin component YwqK of YwqJK toxin-antitoxin module
MKNGVGEGHWVFHHENGRVLGKGPMKNGEREGLLVVYQRDGSKSDRSGFYRNGKKVSA